MLMILKFIPGMHLRVSDDIEEIGLDMDQFDDEVSWMFSRDIQHCVLTVRVGRR